MRRATRRTSAQGFEGCRGKSQASAMRAATRTLRPRAFRLPLRPVPLVVAASLVVVLLTSAAPSLAQGAYPQIISMSPQSGRAGTLVTFEGRYLDGLQAVRFHNHPASFKLLSSTRFQAVVPAEATTGKVSITTPLGEKWSESSFRVTGSGSSTGSTPAPAPAPATSTAPSSAPAAPGASPNAAPNLAPVARIRTSTLSALVGSTVRFSGRRSSDADGSIVSFVWRFGDGTSRTGPRVSHAYRAAGRYTVRLTVTDNRGAGSSVTTTIAVRASDSAPAPAPSSGTSVIRVDQPFICSGPVNLDLVRVTMRNRDADAITIASGCTGRIGRVEVQTWHQDGIKVQNQANPAHDLVIEGGYVKAWAMTPGAHQDGIQVMGGSRLTFKNLRVDVVGAQNLFINKAGSGATTPTDIVCENCSLGPYVATPLRVNVAIRSGARYTLVCTSYRYGLAMSFSSASLQPVNTGNTVAPVGDSRCRDLTGL